MSLRQRTDGSIMNVALSAIDRHGDAAAVSPCGASFSQSLRRGATLLASPSPESSAGYRS
jgi:hypothetical protein